MVHDGAAIGTQWGKMGWTDSTPAGAMIDMQMRAAERPAALDLQAYPPVSKNLSFSATGRYIQVRTRLTNTNNDSPINFTLGTDLNFERNLVGLDFRTVTVDVGAACIAVGNGQCSSAPEPSSFGLVGLALVGLLVPAARRRRGAAAAG